MMNIETLQRQFTAIGARLKVEVDPMRRVYGGRLVPAIRAFTVDIAEDRQGEYFKLQVTGLEVETMDMVAVDIQPKLRHLLLVTRRLDPVVKVEKQKFLCGHDERHWFIAAVTDSPGVSSVETAMEALKPEIVRDMQVRLGVHRKNRHRRRNAGFVRQGEWFFVPRPEFQPTALDVILEDEPIRRGAGKPHFVEILCRNGGTTVYVHNNYPNGLTQAEYEALLKRKPKARDWSWAIMNRDPQVYAKGRIRHPDHATIFLPIWHQVVMNRETLGRNVAFLD